MNITFVTGNKAKARDTQQILGTKISVKNIDLEEIQDLDVEKVTLHKLKIAYDIVKSPVIVDDVGLYIDTWNGFPGPFIKWVLKAGKGDASILLKMMQNETNRKAEARLGIGYHDGKNPYVFTGVAKGTIAKKMRGENGFGWDAVFVPKGHKKTYAQMTLDEKATISHRRKALDKLKNHLSKNNLI